MDTEREQMKRPKTDEASVTDVSVEVVTVDARLDTLCRKYGRRRRPGRKKQKGRKPSPFWNLQNLVILLTVVIFVVMVIMWSLLWIFIFQRETSSGVYFAGMLRIANMEYIPEYRHSESSEFLSMANRIQQVVNNVYKTSSVSRFYRHSVISDLSNNNKGGLLVHFWMVFVSPRLKSATVCEECVGAILRDSILTSLQNRSSVGYLLGLPVDIDSILVNVALRSDYTATTTDSKCVDKLYTTLPGATVPLNVFSAGGGLSCYIKLSAASGCLLRLSITAFGIEPSDCVGDALTVYDTLLPMRLRTLYRLCQPVLDTFSLVSTGNVMLLSVRLTPGNKSFRGHFQAIEVEECFNRIQTETQPGFTGEMASPFYPSLLPPSCTCTWLFQTPSNSLGVALKFHNYALKPKDVKGCDHGWWKVNEIIYCGSYVGYSTVFRIFSPAPKVEFRCSSQRSDLPFRAEYGSFNISQPCPDKHFLCGTGICVEVWRRCDGLDDCQDESDEVDEVCTRPSKNCEGSMPVHPLYVCNGERDCPDGHDEMNCTLETSCSDMRFKCDSGACILKKNAKCDGIQDCLDSSDESNCVCGRPSLGNGRVVGGSSALEGEWPWQASLHFAGHLYCGASVISALWLLSAAHCFSKDRLSDPRQWAIHLGMLVQGSAKHVAEVRRIVLHEYYDPRSFDYDVALLQLKKTWPASLGAYIQPVCLPSASHTLPDGHRCWVTGWGYRAEGDTVLPSVLQKAQVRLYNQSECKKVYSPVSPRMLCAGVSSGEQDACRGDSGGPLSCQVPGGRHWFLTGIVSWGAGCGRPKLPGVYTRVSKFTAWIQSHIL